MAHLVKRSPAAVFTSALEKVAALPTWLHMMVKGKDTRRSVPAYSAKGVQKMLARRGLK